MPSKRSVLEAIKPNELRYAMDALDLKPENRRSRDALIGTLSSSRKATLEAILETQSRDTLQRLCPVKAKNLLAYIEYGNYRARVCLLSFSQMVYSKVDAMQGREDKAWKLDGLKPSKHIVQALVQERAVVYIYDVV